MRLRLTTTLVTKKVKEPQKTKGTGKLELCHCLRHQNFSRFSIPIYKMEETRLDGPQFLFYEFFFKCWGLAAYIEGYIRAL